MRSLILSAILGAGALAGTAAASTDPGPAVGVPLARPDAVSPGDRYHVPDSFRDTPFADPYNLLYFVTPVYVLRQTAGSGGLSLNLIADAVGSE